MEKGGGDNERPFVITEEGGKAHRIRRGGM